MIFSYQFLLRKYGINPRGIIHIGAHHAEESTVYSKSGTDKILWIEANPALIPVIKENISIYSQNKVYNILLSDSNENEVRFIVTNASMSSSILSLGTHKDQYPDIIVEKELYLNSVRFDTFIKEKDLNINEYNFVNIDIQGAELLALKGFGALLDNIDFIYTEVNVDNVYEDCALLDEMDNFLLNKGFKRVELSLKYQSWGDAFYIRKKVTKLEKVKTLAESKLLISNIRTNKLNSQIRHIKKQNILFKILRKVYHKIKKYIKKLI